jgi:hypothetical protein
MVRAQFGAIKNWLSRRGESLRKAVERYQFVLLRSGSFWHTASCYLMHGSTHAQNPRFLRLGGREVIDNDTRERGKNASNKKLTSSTKEFPWLVAFRPFSMASSMIDCGPNELCAVAPTLHSFIAHGP